MDVGKRTCVVCVMDKDGNILERGKYPNTRRDADGFMAGMRSRYGECEAVCESTANMWRKTQWACKRNRVRLRLANPLRLKMSQSGVKTDKLDAERLANRLRMGDIPESHQYSKASQRSLDLLRHRISLVRTRARILSTQHNLLDKYDVNPYACGSTHMAGPKCQRYIGTQKLDPGDTRVMAAHIRHVRFLTREIDTINLLVDKDAFKNDDARIIMSIPGLDAFGALLLAVSIDGIKRFSGPKQLVSFLGLCPRVYQSGDRTRYGRMKKDADGTLTWIMMNAAMVAHRHDPLLSACYEHARKRHPPMVARSHLANRMATILYYMLKNEEPYRHRNEDTYQRKLGRLKE